MSALQGYSRYPQRGQHSREHDRRGPLDVVVECRDPIAIFAQQPERIVGREVLELDHNTGVKRTGSDTNSSTRASYSSPRTAADANRYRADRRAVRSCWSRRREAPAGTRSGHTRTCGIERELADRNAHAVGTQVAQAEDALAVADDDDRHVATRPVGEHLRDAAAVGCTDEDAVRTLKDVGVPLTGQPDRRRVDDRHHFIRMIHQQAKEKCLVTIVQRPQIDVLLEIAGLAAKILQHSPRLLLLRGDVRRQQPPQVQGIAFGFLNAVPLLRAGSCKSAMPLASTVGVLVIASPCLFCNIALLLPLSLALRLEQQLNRAAHSR